MPSDLSLEILVDELAIAIPAFDPAFVGRDLQPDTRMTQCTLASVTGDPVAVDDARLWGLDGHQGASSLKGQNGDVMNKLSVSDKGQPAQGLRIAPVAILQVFLVWRELMQLYRSQARNLRL